MQSGETERGCEEELQLVISQRAKKKYNLWTKGDRFFSPFEIAVRLLDP